MMETPKEAKKDKLVIDEEKVIHIDVPFEYADAELLAQLKMAWLDTAMRGILPPSIYSARITHPRKVACLPRRGNTHRLAC